MSEKALDYSIYEILLQVNRKESELDPKYEWNIEYNESIKGGSKKKTGNKGRPEFICTSKSCDPTFAVVIENKRDIKQHKNNLIGSPQNYAVEGSLHYAKILIENKEYDLVVAVGISGTPKDHKISGFLVSKEKGVVDLNIQDILSVKDYYRCVLQTSPDFTKKHAQLVKDASDLHNFMRDYAKVSETEKPLLVAGILIALTNKPFTSAYKKEANAEKLAEFIVYSINSVLEESGIDLAKIQRVTRQFNFIQDHPELNKGNVLRDIIVIIENKLLPFINKFAHFDLLGEFYDEFLSYVGGDKQTLGIVLTPRHITELFMYLVDLNKDTILLDTCAGTGGFLISGMQRMMELAGNDPKKINNIKRNQLIGVEQQPNMFALAASNMLLRSDGTANLFLGSCFDDGIIQAISHRRPTAGAINPPYSQKGEGLHELDFLIQMLEELEPGSIGAAIVPMSCALEKSGLKEKLMKSHTLMAVMSMPDSLFHPVGTITCTIVCISKRPHKENYKTWFAMWKDDGFEKIRGSGRRDVNDKWSKIKTFWIETYTNKVERRGYSILKSVGAGDEWCAEAYIETDFSAVLHNNSIESAVKNFIKWRVDNDPNFLSTVGHQSITKANRTGEDVAWKPFKYMELFDIHNGKTEKIDNDTEITNKAKATPIIGSSAINNGIAGYTKEAPTEGGKQLTISIRGGGVAFYQEKPFIPTLNCLVLTPKFEINRSRALFLCAVIGAECFRYCYGRIRSMGRVKEELLYLPVKPNGDIDWDFIELTIKTLPISRFIE